MIATNKCLNTLTATFVIKKGPMLCFLTYMKQMCDPLIHLVLMDGLNVKEYNIIHKLKNDSCPNE